MVKSLKIIRDDFHAQFLEVRQCKYLIDHEDFEIAWQEASEESKKLLLADIKKGNYKNLKNILRDFMSEQINNLTPFEKLSIRKIHHICNFLSIPYYKNKTKSELIKEIKNVTERLKAGGKRLIIQSEQAYTVSESALGRR